MALCNSEAVMIKVVFLGFIVTSKHAGRCLTSVAQPQELILSSLAESFNGDAVPPFPVLFYYPLLSLSCSERRV